MRKYYEMPKMDVFMLEKQEVICTSSDPTPPPIMGEDGEGAGGSTSW